jgi:CRP-like cAMP-binding protein
MKTSLIRFASKYITLTQAEELALTQSIPVITYPRGTVLLEAGKALNVCYFILQGLVREYYIVDGEEITTAFYREEQPISSSEGFMHNKPSAYYLSCMEDCTVAVADFGLESDLYARFPKFETLTRILSEKILSENQDSFSRFKLQSPTERYQTLLREKPDLVQRVPQYQLAGYLGIKPETLSRIRRRMMSGNS